MSARRSRSQPRSGGGSLSHVGADGEARMVDVSAKEVTERAARARGAIVMTAPTLAAIRADAIGKGDVVAVAKVAGIMAAKRTSELIPLCHPVALSDVQVQITLDEGLPGARVESAVKAAGKTGVEMEAIVAVAVTLVTLYDMCKSLDKGMRITDIELLEKSGGRSGHWQRG